MITTADNNVTEGNIIQQIPKAGEPLPEGGTVYLIYSLGPEIKLTTVPGVTGMTQTEAVRILQSKELGYKIEYVDSEVQVDVVIDQSIDENEEVPEKTVVVLTVSSGSLSNNNSGSDNDSETEDGGLGIFG